MPSHNKGPPLRRSLRKCPKLSQSGPFTKLNDDIIVSHILPRLSLQEAVRTSVLSRRWLTLWVASIGPKLIFTFSVSRKTSAFVRRFASLLKCGVTNVLNAYTMPTLDELTICFGFNSRSSQFIDSWVQYAFGKGVTRLHLDFLRPIFCSQSNMYTFPGIDKLSALHMLCNNDLHRPGMYNLRDVCLKSINVHSDVVEFMLSHCPFLERLSVWFSRDFSGDIRVSAQSSKLKTLEFVDCYYYDIYISSPNLVSLQYSGIDDVLHLEYVPLLSELSIGSDYCRYFLREGLIHFGYISQLKKLTLDLRCEVISESVTYPLEISKLMKLEELEVKLKAKRGSCLLWLIILIKAAPFLRLFSVKLFTKWQGREDYAKLQQGKYQRKLRKLQNAIKQVHHHQFLKSIEMTNFCGRPMEMELGQHLLEISGSLEQFVVKPLLPWNQQVDTLSSVKRYRERVEQFRNWLPPAVKFVIL